MFQSSSLENQENLESMEQMASINKQRQMVLNLNFKTSKQEQLVDFIKMVKMVLMELMLQMELLVHMEKMDYQLKVL
jgi:hypothetical protein